MPEYTVLYITSTSSGAPIDLSDEFIELITELQETDPGIVGRMMAQIGLQLPFWEPGLEDRDRIRHVKSISKHCKYKVYRLKDPAISGWRVFFFELNLTKPRKRFVATAIQRGTDDETYDPKAEHCRLIERLIREEEAAGRLTRRR